MKRIYLFACIALLLAPAGALAQSRTRRTPAPPPPPSRTGVLLKRDGADRVSIQINNLARFLYLLGGVSKVIEDTDIKIKAGDATRDLARQNNASKGIVRSSIHNFVDGLDQLEIDFRASPALQKYYPTIKGTAAKLAAAEDQSAAGQLKSAAQTLQAALDQLTQVLVAMSVG